VTHSDEWTTRVVAERAVVDLTVDGAQKPERMTVTVRMDASHAWTFEEPGWLPIRFGFAAGLFYLWSARRLIVFGLDRTEPVSVPMDDDDIHYVFASDGRWLLVCETSIRLMDGGR